MTTVWAVWAVWAVWISKTAPGVSAMDTPWDRQEGPTTRPLHPCSAMSFQPLTKLPRFTPVCYTPGTAIGTGNLERWHRES